MEATKKVSKRGKGRKGKALERAIVIEEPTTAASTTPSKLISSVPTSSVNVHDVPTSSVHEENNATDLNLTSISTLATENENAASESEAAAAMRMSAVSLALEGLHIAFGIFSR